MHAKAGLHAPLFLALGSGAILPNVQLLALAQTNADDSGELLDSDLSTAETEDVKDNDEYSTPPMQQLVLTCDAQPARGILCGTMPDTPASPTAVPDSPVTHSSSSSTDLSPATPLASTDALTMQCYDLTSVSDPLEHVQEQSSVSGTDQRAWISGTDVPHAASLSILTNKQLAHALVHHKFLFWLPWWYNSK